MRARVANKRAILGAGGINLMKAKDDHFPGKSESGKGLLKTGRRR